MFCFRDESGISGLSSKCWIQNTPLVACILLRYCAQTNGGWSLYKELCLKPQPSGCAISLATWLTVWRSRVQPNLFVFHYLLLCLCPCIFSFVLFINLFFCLFFVFSFCSADAWLSAAVDCLEFLPDQLVIEVSRGLAKCPEETAQYKRLLYSILIQHYGQTDYPPLFSNHVFDIHSGTSELLGKTGEEGLW